MNAKVAGWRVVGCGSGFVMLFAGITSRWGPDLACVVCGSILFAVNCWFRTK